ncbi:hypothetical protein FACS1894126_4830 [Alphaproteobacteria bacterium]|nr:hypothetical protein FACS1894126_4830 [Alphaproteobacteria bacterium]
MTEYMSKEIMSRIHTYARKLCKLKSLHFMDHEDIQQELLCELISSAKAYDQSKGDFLHFANVVLQKKYLMLIEKYNREKRGAKALIFEYDDEHFQSQNISLDRILEAIDLEKLISRLPNRYRDVINLFLNHSVSEILDMTGHYRSSRKAVKQKTHVRHALFRSTNAFLLIASPSRQNCVLAGANLSRKQFQKNLESRMFGQHTDF